MNGLNDAVQLRVHRLVGLLKGLHPHVKFLQFEFHPDVDANQHAYSAESPHDNLRGHLCYFVNGYDDGRDGRPGRVGLRGDVVQTDVYIR